MNKKSTNYENLFKICQKNIEDIKLKQAIYYKNKKNALFKNIVHNVYEKIINASLDGYESMILYENEYNELIPELMNDFKSHFKPFNIVYKKKNINERGFMEILTEDINYILVIDWKKPKENTQKYKEVSIQTEDKKIEEEENKTNDDDTISNSNSIEDTSSNNIEDTSSNNIKDTFDELIISEDEKEQVNKDNFESNHRWIGLFN